jgi:putative transposase
MGESGVRGGWLTPHMEYTRLGRSQNERQSAYRQLFQAAISGQDLNAIRESTHKGWALGGERFKKQVEALTNRRASSKGVGRPRNSE